MTQEPHKAPNCGKSEKKERESFKTRYQKNLNEEGTLLEPVPRDGRRDTLAVEPLEHHRELNGHSAHFLLEIQVLEIQTPVVCASAQEGFGVCAQTAGGTKTQDSERLAVARALVIIYLVLVSRDILLACVGGRPCVRRGQGLQNGDVVYGGAFGPENAEVDTGPVRVGSTGVLRECCFRNELATTTTTIRLIFARLVLDAMSRFDGESLEQVPH